MENKLTHLVKILKPKVRTGNYDEFIKCLELINLEAIDEKGYKNEYRGDVKVTIYKKSS